MRKVLVVCCAVAALFGLSAVLVSADPPQVTGEIHSVTPANPVYGDSVTFDTTVDNHKPKYGKGKVDRVFLTVTCLQQDQIVYRWSSSLTFAYPLEDQIAVIDARKAISGPESSQINPDFNRLIARIPLNAAPHIE